MAHCPLFPIYLVILSDFSLKGSLHALRLVGMTGLTLIGLSITNGRRETGSRKYKQTNICTEHTPAENSA